MVKASPVSLAFAKAVKQERIKKGITQEELADRCGLDRSYISRIERGFKNPTLSVVWDVATIGLEIGFLSLMEIVMRNMSVVPQSKE